MYKFMQMRPKKPQNAEEGQTTAVDDEEVDSDAEDPELEKFANEEMDREMKRMA